MTALHKLHTGAVAVLLLISVQACSGRGVPVDAGSAAAYNRALEDHHGSASEIDGGVASFRATFSDLKVEDFASRVKDLYAESFYFNDTIHSFSQRDELVDYLRATSDRLDSSRVEIQQVVTDGADVFVRWSMQFSTRVAGRRVVSDSIGMSHLRFDGEGRIVLHQDYWDSGNALYAHLPVVGFLVRRARDSM